MKFAKISQNLSSDAGLTQGNHTCSIQMKFVKISKNVSSAAVVIGALRVNIFFFNKDIVWVQFAVENKGMSFAKF